jgi:hypothetical protein
MAYFTRTYRRAWSGPGLLPLIYLVVGILVAASHEYLRNVHTFNQFASAVLSVLLWPLLLIGIDLQVH